MGTSPHADLARPSVQLCTTLVYFCGCFRGVGRLGRGNKQHWGHSPRHLSFTAEPFRRNSTGHRQCEPGHSTPNLGGALLLQQHSHSYSKSVSSHPFFAAERLSAACGNVRTQSWPSEPARTEGGLHVPLQSCSPSTSRWGEHYLRLVAVVLKKQAAQGAEPPCPFLLQPSPSGENSRADASRRPANCGCALAHETWTLSRPPSPVERERDRPTMVLFADTKTARLGVLGANRTSRGISSESPPPDPGGGNRSENCWGCRGLQEMCPHTRYKRGSRQAHGKLFAPGVTRRAHVGPLDACASMAIRTSRTRALQHGTCSTSLI